MSFYIYNSLFTDVGLKSHILLFSLSLSLSPFLLWLALFSVYLLSSLTLPLLFIFAFSLSSLSLSWLFLVGLNHWLLCLSGGFFWWLLGWDWWWVSMGVVWVVVGFQFQYWSWIGGDWVGFGDGFQWWVFQWLLGWFRWWLGWLWWWVLVVIFLVGVMLV